MRNVIYGCLIAVAAIVVLVVVLFAALVGWSFYANKRAEEGARGLCARIPIGAPFATVLKEASRDPKPAREFREENKHHFMYYGQILSSRECIVDIRDGRVAAKRVQVNED
jgi:hypothetical protein